MLSLFLNDELYAMRGRNNGWVEIDGDMLSQLLNSEAEEEDEAHDDNEVEVVAVDKLLGQEERVDIVLDALLGNFI